MASFDNSDNKMMRKGDGGVLRLKVAYAPHLTRDEHRPKMKVWISFDHHKSNAQRWTVTKKLYKNLATSSATVETFDVPLPSDSDLPSFPLDAAIHFQVYTKMTDSHSGGDDPEENYEKDGSGMIYLAQIFSGKKHLTKPVVPPLVVQSYIIEKPKPVIKGKLAMTLQREGTNISRRLVFSPASRWDVVPANVKNLQADIFTLIQRNLIIFDPKIMKKAGVDFKLSLKEGKRVHAPLFVNSTGLISPGECYFDNTSHHGTEWDEGFFSQILDISLSRAGWTRRRYVETIKAQHDVTTTTKNTSWAEYINAVRITGQALSVVSNSLPYIADLAEDDSRKKEVVESFDDPLSKNDADCEDVAWLIGEIYRGIRNGSNFTEVHLLAAQEVLRLFKGCAALGTVTSRNLDEASPGQGKAKIASKRDQKVITGAHMTFIMLTRVFYWEMLRRTSSDIQAVEQHSEPSFVTRHPTTGAIVRQEWEHKLPVMIIEGTGGMRCTPRAGEANFESRPEKEQAILDDIKHREAFSRFLTGLSPQQRSQMNPNRIQILPGFKGMQILRTQDALVNDPTVRLNSFFRMQTELFPIPERHEEIGSYTKDPSSAGPSDPYSLRKIIPVQIYPRRGPPEYRCGWY